MEPLGRGVARRPLEATLRRGSSRAGLSLSLACNAAKMHANGCLNIWGSPLTSTNNPLEVLITKAAYEFMTEFAQARALFKDEDARNNLTHAGEFGGYRERIVGALIKKFLPKHFSIGDGFAVNTASIRTKQIDLIVYDAQITPTLESAGTRFFPYEAVVALGEVKSTLDYKGLRTAIDVMRENKRIRECAPHNPFPIRPAGLSESIVHHLTTVEPAEFNKWRDFTHLEQALSDFKNGVTPSTPTESQNHKSLVFNPKYFEELNVVSFLVCDQITGFHNMDNIRLGQMLYTRDTANEHIGFNLILSIQDGLILHSNRLAGGSGLTPFPKHRNYKSIISILKAEPDDVSHIVTFVSMLLHAISRTAIFEFSPLPYLAQLNETVRTSTKFRNLYE